MAKKAQADYNTPIQHLANVTTTGPTSFTGTVERVIFNRGLFFIVAVSVEDANFEWDTDKITVTGQLGEVNEGDQYEFDGRVVDNPCYGLQFNSNGCHAVLPHTAKTLTRFLRGRHLPLNHVATAARQIFDHFGKEAVNHLLEQPTDLAEIKTMDAADQQILIKLFNQLSFCSSTSQIIQRLKGLGFSERFVNLIFDQYGTRALQILDDNPYQYAVDLQEWGLTFLMVDQIAQESLGIAGDDARRIQGALLCLADDLTNQQGGTYVQVSQLLQQAQQRLNFTKLTVDQGQVQTQLQILLEDKRLYQENGTDVYPASLYQAEWQIAQELHDLTANPIEVDEDQLTEVVKTVSDQQDIQYDEIQIDAIKLALSSRVMMITGGPGTGKTTILNGIVQSYLRLYPDKTESNVRLVAPTGRAAKQINGVTGIDASTIHRLLGLTLDNSAEELLQGNDLTAISGDLLIVDEMSMTSTILFATLLSAVENNCQLILVGDVDQLPSVGPGQVFHDLLAFDQLPQCRLSHIYRQGDDSSIIPLAQRINQGQVDPVFFAPTPANRYARRQFIRCSSQVVARRIGEIIQLYQSKYQQQLMDIQVLTPFHGGASGTDSLNQYLQELLNPVTDQQPVYRSSQGELRIGDKVMQTINDAERNVFNGDVGIIKTIEGNAVLNGDSQEKFSLKMTVDFDGQEIEYERPNQVAALQLAYCMTIHKSQGSQSPVVIIPLFNDQFYSASQHETILHRNLLYTAVTRTSRALMMLGDPEAFVQCSQSPTVYRATSLTKRLVSVWKNSEAKETASQVASEDRKDAQGVQLKRPGVLTAQMVLNEEVDPMIGMTGIKPQDF